MTVYVENLQSCSIAYIRTTGPYGAANAVAMEQLKKWAAKNGLFGEGAVILGIAQDNPETTQPDCCRYDTCIVIPEDFSTNDSAVCRGSITGGKYAVFSIEHTAAEVQLAWADIFPEISKQGWQLDPARPVLERYQMKLVLRHECEICVPLV